MSSDPRERFVWGAETVLTQCAYCKHAAPGPDAVCAAFPGQIPPEILANEVDHRQPWIDPATNEPGDEGVALAGSITFSPAEGVTPDALAVLYRHLDALAEESS